MTLNGKCHAGDICVVLDKKTCASRGVFKMEFGGAIRPYYYEAHQTLILSPATDIEDLSLQTIIKAIAHAGDAIKRAEEPYKSIIIPVAEQQRVFGFPRNHWVTLHYDLTLKVCTLIDSRHWSFSYLYPIKSMWDMFKTGLDAVGVDTNGIVYNQIHQSVQLNDIYCGSWTLMNILALAGALSDDTPSKTIEAIKTMFSAEDEVDIVNKIIDFSESTIQKLSPLTGVLDRSFMFLGLRSYPLGERFFLNDISQDRFVSSIAMITNVVRADRSRKQLALSDTTQCSKKEPSKLGPFPCNVSDPSEAYNADAPYSVRPL